MPHIYFLVRENSNDEPVRDVLACCLAGPDNLHDLAAAHPVVARDRVGLLDARQLSVLELVTLQKDGFLLPGSASEGMERVRPYGAMHGLGRGPRTSLVRIWCCGTST